MSRYSFGFPCLRYRVQFQDRPNILIYVGICGKIFIRLLNGKFSGIKAVKCERLLWARPNECSEGCVRGQTNQEDLARHVVRGGKPAWTAMAEPMRLVGHLPTT